MIYELTDSHGLTHKPLYARVVPRPIARLGYTDYTVVDEILSMTRPAVGG